MDKLEILSQFQKKYGAMINPELVSIKYCQAESEAFVEMLFSNNTVPVVINLDFIADDSKMNDNNDFDAIPNLFNPEADIVDNATCLIEFDPYSLIMCIDNLFTEIATQEIANDYE
jgi:hypothetical protein